MIWFKDIPSINKNLTDQNDYEKLEKILNDVYENFDKIAENNEKIFKIQSHKDKFLFAVGLNGKLLKNDADINNDLASCFKAIDQFMEIAREIGVELRIGMDIGSISTVST